MSDEKYWLCCGSKEFPHNNKYCIEAQTGHPERVVFGTADEHAKRTKGKYNQCPCGKTPTKLCINDSGQGGKWAHVCGNCCNDWELEFRTEYFATTSEECMKLAIERWNDATAHFKA